MSRFKIEQWSEICPFFISFFSTIKGEVVQDENQISFSSHPDSVDTSIQLFRDGTFGATMPLHGIESKVAEVHFQTELHCITFTGEKIQYTYRIPPQLIPHGGI
ncbi:hypothetical protein N9L85_00775 [Euryarchaeota archaeon]|nr:hypothetical protein [Candidatus Poseidoniaceae archaeon]MDA8593890.1 hypothetical protein [Euryarchaeota archaeon]MDA9828314.1 hypothetical protein [Candidatus Poseidoniaceae archaeon]